MCWEILETCVDTLFWGKDAFDWIFQQGAWHLGDSSNFVMDTTISSWNPEIAYERLEKQLWEPDSL
jgi:hypothetical protein